MYSILAPPITDYLESIVLPSMSSIKNLAYLKKLEFFGNMINIGAVWKAEYDSNSFILGNLQLIIVSFFSVIPQDTT